MDFVTVAAFAIGIIGLIWAVAMYLRSCDLEYENERLHQSLGHAAKAYAALDREFAKYQRSAKNGIDLTTVGNRIDRFF